MAVTVHTRDRRDLALAVGASLLAHLLLVLGAADLLRLARPLPTAEPMMTIDVVIEEEKPPAVIAPGDDPPLPLPAVIAPPPPQFEEAPIAERSRPTPSPAANAPPSPPPQILRAAPRPRAAATPARPTPQPEPGDGIVRVPAPSIVDHGAPTIGSSPRGGRGGSSEAAQQSEGDFLLKQIMPHWLLDSRNERFRRVVLGGVFMLNGDGTLASPYGKRDPWAPDVMIQNYDRMQRPELQNVRLALESFLRAARAAQPFRLPPGVTGGYPRPVRIEFKLGDL